MTRRTRTARRKTTRLPRTQRGVVGVLAMMFMVIFGSLAVAMAIVSQGNLQTAQTQLRVNNAIGAADTGQAIAAARLREAARAFRVERGLIDASYALDLWNGTFAAADGAVLDADGDPMNEGLRALLAGLHESDAAVEITLEYETQEGWLATDPIVLERAADDRPITAAQVTYIPLPDTGGVRAVVTGYAWDWVSSRWVSRTAQQDYRIFKRVNQAILGPSKIMIGKNVQVNGPLGARFDGQEHSEGHPLVMRSDFLGLDAVLDQKLEDLFAAILADDVDGDNRLRLNHTIESRQLAQLNVQDYGGDGAPDAAFTDASGDGAIDDFDVFMNHYDANGDGRIVLSAALTAGTPAEGLAAEFDGVDDDLALLIDSANPDRDGNGVIDARDRVLGYRDGVIDYKDRYAKIHGRVAFRTSRAAWEAMDDGTGSSVGHFQRYMRGPIRTERGDRPVTFQAGDDVLPDIQSDTFNTAESDLAAAADGAPFATQAGLAGAAFTLTTDVNGVVVGQAFHESIELITEATPYGAPAAADYYQRPVFRDKVFKNVVIPKGLNALFINCTFAGVTRVENDSANTHPSWQFYGQQLPNLSLRYPAPPLESDAQLDNDYFTGDIIMPDDFNIPRLTVGGTPYVTSKPLSNNIRFHDCTFVGSIVADKPTNYTHVRNKLQFTGATQFHHKHPERPDDPDYNPDNADLSDIARSSMLLPHYSVDIGTNNAPQEQNVNLQGLVIAGVLDVRGNTTIDGALLLTFEPSLDDPALQHFGVPVGNPANFNTTLGYFGPEDGDDEGYTIFEHEGQRIVGFDTNGDGLPDTVNFEEGAVPVPFNGYGRIVLNWDPDLVMPDGLIAPIQIEALPSSYREGRLVQGDYQ